ncbi:unnamed protein product [Cutaneotrichosporon oleaginosum]
MGVVDAIIELNDQLRYEHGWLNRGKPDSPDEWHDWIKEATGDIVQVARDTFNANAPGCGAIIDKWDASGRDAVVHSCMDHMWRVTDSGGHRDRELIPWDIASPYLYHHVPGELEKGLKWSGCEVEINDKSKLRPVTYTWAGVDDLVPHYLDDPRGVADLNHVDQIDAPVVAEKRQERQEHQERKERQEQCVHLH